MKKIVLICILLAGFNTMAQEREGRSNGRNYLKEMTPEQVATLSSKRLALALDLNEGQRTQVMDLQLQRIKERRAFMESREGSGTDSSRAELSPEDRYERLNTRLDRKLAYKASMKKILSEKQYEDWVNMQHDGKRKGQMHRRQQRHGGKR